MIKIMQTCILILIVGMCPILMGSCANREESFYNSTKEKDTVQAYEEYIKAYPRGIHVASARERIELLHLLEHFRSGIRNDHATTKVETILQLQRTDNPSRLKELVPDLIFCLLDKSKVTINDADDTLKVKAGHEVPGVPRELGLSGWSLPPGGSATGIGTSGGKPMDFRFSYVGKESAVALSRITGQNFGEEQSKWEGWWKQQKGN